MEKIRIFVSSVQSEFASERATLRDYVRSDALLRRFFDVFLFEDIPASDHRPDQLYLGEVENCEIYLGIFGNKYGFEDSFGVSPTEQEFDLATSLGKQRLIFIKGTSANSRNEKMQALIDKAENDVVRRKFSEVEDLKAGLYAALVEYLGDRELLRDSPFDMAHCDGTSFDDLDLDQIHGFIRAARETRQFPLGESTSSEDLLRHLNLFNKDRLTNAAILLFGKEPQRFLLSSEVKCAHFHGTKTTKPIPSFQVYRGTVFQMVDQAVDFVLSKIAFSGRTYPDSQDLRDSQRGRYRSHC